MSTRLADRIEDDLRAAFRAAAAEVRPAGRPLPAGNPGTAPIRRSGARRWLVPGVAAAVVAAIGVPLLAFSLAGGPGAPDIAAASAVTMSGGRASVAGISFPVPAGWAAKTVATDATSVTVCVSARPSAECGGVTLRIAVPDGDGNITPVSLPLAAESRADMSMAPGASASSPPTSAAIGSASAVAGETAGSSSGVASTAASPPTEDPGSGTCQMLVDFAPLGDRPAVHYSIGLCASGSPQSLDWYVTDGSLDISTPRGVANQQAAQIAAAIDFSGYHHDYGPQFAFFSGPGVASSSGGMSSPAPFEGRAWDVDGVRIPVPQGWTADTTDKGGASATVCVAGTPSPNCDGVTVRFATGTTSLPVQDLFSQACSDGHDSMWTDHGVTTIGARPARYYTGCHPGTLEVNLWLLTDGSLAVWTPAGKYADLGATIAAGIDLDGWDHRQGPVVVAPGR